MTKGKHAGPVEWNPLVSPPRPCPRPLQEPLRYRPDRLAPDIEDARAKLTVLPS